MSKETDKKRKDEEDPELDKEHDEEEEEEDEDGELSNQSIIISLLLNKVCLCSRDGS